jgi:nucleoside recognition membrane protein YjiH
MRKTIQNNKEENLIYRVRIFWTLVFGIIVLAPFYAISVHSAIVNVVERENIVSMIREKSTEVSETESKYFALKNKINMNMAYSKGYQEAEVSSFISKKSLTAIVSYNEQ